MKERVFKKVALAMCAIILASSIAGAVPMYAEASTLTHASLYKVVDMSLASTGIVANSAIINQIAGTFETDFMTQLNDFLTWMQETYGKDYSEYKTALDEYRQTDNIFEIYPHLVNAIEQGWDLWEITADNIADILVGAKPDAGITKGIGYKISDDAVEHIRSVFDDYAETEADFYYIDTVGPDDIHPGWFPTKAWYETIKGIVADSPYPMIMEFTNGTKGTFFSTTSENTSLFSGIKLFVCDNGLLLYHCDNNDTNNLYYVYASDNDWDNLTSKYGSNGTYQYITYSDYETFYEGATNISNVSVVISRLERSLVSTNGEVGICTNDGRKMKVFKDASTMKLYSCGQQSYYLNQSNDYSTTNDNSVTFSGDYYQDNSDSYSYDIVQNEIDNSTEINEETVNNIVNSTTTTIVNNYYTSSGDGSGDSSGGGSSGEGLAGLIESIGGFLDFLLGLIGSIVNLLTTFLNSALTLISSLGSLFSDFGSLLGDMFVFIPAELINSIVAGITLLIFLAIYRAFR